MHVEMTIDQMFGGAHTPTSPGGRYPGPTGWLAGASTHPGGGVTGTSGRLAARAILHRTSKRRGLGTTARTIWHD